MANSLARALRRQATDAEQKLWKLLRERQLAGFRFRRQVPLGDYIVDFACFSKRLILEIDGGQHAISMERDHLRTMWLESQGFIILRFWNNDVLDNPEGVCATILEALRERNPLP